MADFKIKSTSKSILATMIILFSVLYVLSNIVSAPLFAWFVLIFGLGLSAFIISETGVTEYLTHSPGKHITVHNVTTIFSGFIAGIIAISSILTFVAYQGVMMPSAHNDLSEGH